jgi:hypothetical protein
MRSIAISCGVAIGLLACGKGGEQAAIEEAQKEAEAAQKEKARVNEPAKVMRPPVPGQAKIPCSQLIDLAKYQEQLAEKEPLTLKDQSKGDKDATSSCAIHRGGKRPGEAEQKALSKKEGRLGVLPGDELCHVTALCSTIESHDRVKMRCKEKKFRDDESMGSYACVQVVAQGADDVPVFTFFDEDTRCVLVVGGGPSNVNGDTIRTCAKVARDSIGPDQIVVNAQPAAPPAGGSGE